MILTRVFRTVVVLGTFAFVAYWFLPYFYKYLDPEVYDLLAHAGFQAIFSGNAIISYLSFTAWMACAVGLFFYKNIARKVFLFLLLLSPLETLLYGVSIETALGTMLIDITHLTDGIIIALAYFSPVKEKFESMGSDTVLKIKPDLD